MPYKKTKGGYKSSQRKRTIKKKVKAYNASKRKGRK